MPGGLNHSSSGSIQGPSRQAHVPTASQWQHAVVCADSAGCSSTQAWVSADAVACSRTATRLGSGTEPRAGFSKSQTAYKWTERDFFCPPKPTVVIPESQPGTCISALATFCESILDHTNPESWRSPFTRAGCKVCRPLPVLHFVLLAGRRCLLICERNPNGCKGDHININYAVV